MNCTVDAREQARAVARQLDTDPRVLAVDVIEPITDPTDRWAVDLILCSDCDGIPSPVIAVLAEYGLTIRHAGPRGDHWQALATA